MKTLMGAWVAAALAAGAIVVATAGGASAESVRSQCSSEYAAAKTANTLNGQSWNDFYAACKAHCPTDTVVWLNTKSHKYHFEGHRAYGKTKQGAYICEADAKAAGGVPAKGETPK